MNKWEEVGRNLQKIGCGLMSLSCLVPLLIIFLVFLYALVAGIGLPDDLS